jgi:protein-tyrosine kinase
VNIIERAAELLGSAPQTGQKPSTVSRGAGKLEQDLVERSAAEISRRRDSLEDKPARATGGTSRTVRVGRDRLLRQSIITPDSERTAVAESFRRIKQQILANLAGPETGAPPANLVLVTSAVAGEGKTFCAINLAISIALEMDRTALLIDADVAKPAVLRTLGLEAEKGLMDALLDPRVDLAEVLCKTDIGRLTLMPSGTTHRHATELLASDAMRRLLHDMAERYRDRVIIFDSPPLLAASEAGALASQMGQIVVVVEAGKTSEAALKEALGRIASMKVAGLVLNKGKNPSLEYGYGSYG